MNVLNVNIHDDVNMRKGGVGVSNRNGIKVSGLQVRHRKNITWA